MPTEYCFRHFTKLLVGRYCAALDLDAECSLRASCLGSIAVIKGLAAILCTLDVISLALIYFIPTPPSKIAMATSAIKGTTYDYYAQRYRERFARANVKLEFRESAGSAETFSLLQDAVSGVQFASPAFPPNRGLVVAPCDRRQKMPPHHGVGAWHDGNRGELPAVPGPKPDAGAQRILLVNGDSWTDYGLPSVDDHGHLHIRNWLAWQLLHGTQVGPDGCLSVTFTMLLVPGSAAAAVSKRHGLC
jgi:hypothetical protein